MARGQADIPKWKRDRWVVLSKFFADPKVQDELRKYESFIGNDLIPLKFYELLLSHSIPEDCSEVVLYKIANPDAKDEELIALVQSPVEYISHYYRQQSPALDPGKHYEEERRRVEQKIEVYGTDKANEDTSVYIKIAPFTSRVEVQSFIDDNWGGIEKLLQKSNKESDGTFDPALLKGRKRGLVDRGNRESIEGIMEMLKTQGLNATQISEYLANENMGDIDPANIRRILSRRKKKL